MLLGISDHRVAFASMALTFGLKTVSARVAPHASLILRPGTRGRDSVWERHVVRCGGSLVVNVATADRLTFRDVEGGQPCEMAFCDLSGRFDAAALGARADGKGNAMRRVVGRNDPSACRTRATLARSGIDLATAESITIFSNSSRPGSTATFFVARPGIVIVATLSVPMRPQNQNTATDVELAITRAAPPTAKPDHDLPEPLAEPVQDIRICAASAEAYIVRAGEFIQVIDVSGRQCTDFQALSLRNVDKGLDLALDSTVTRTLLGRSYPAPGLPSQAFDREFEPLIEIVQDTVGRHDAFATACNSRYYDDFGYPGHANCTDNFNAALAPFGVLPRKGWEALNYFYNTNIDHLNQIYLDEPWSRPGDYVLMRALTDLVCVSSACPDDIDAANGWEPSDIHIRTYSAKQTFKRAIAYRPTPDADAQTTKETAFHPRFSALTPNYVEYRGYWLPSSFASHGTIAEYWACRERAAITDRSPLRKFEITGPDAEALLNYCLTRDISKMATGSIIYSAMCYANGGIVDDGTIFRLGTNNFRWIGGDDYSGVWLREQAEKQGYKTWVRSSTEQLHNIAVRGPSSRDILQKVVWTSSKQIPVSELGGSQFCVGRILYSEGPPVVVSRADHADGLGFEIFCHPKDALAIFDGVWGAGEGHGLTPMGLDALNILRVEAGHVSLGLDFSSETDPFEAGIGFTVPLESKRADFIDRTALSHRAAHPRYRLVGLHIASNDAVGHGDAVYVGREKVGVVTSSVRSPLLGKTIGYARLGVANAAEGTALEIGKLDGYQKRFPATIVALPHLTAEYVAGG